MRFLLMVFLMSLACLSAFAAEDSATGLDPYIQEDHRQFEFDEQQYRDLEAYLQKAKRILESALKDSRNLSGVALHKRLHHAVRASLQTSVYQSRLFLFRRVLDRALVVDEIYRKASPYGIESSSTRVLVRNILLALRYYKEEDLPRTKHMIVVAPDWTKFARDQIDVLLAMAALAPSEQAKIEVTRRALGWTGRALNSAIERRDHAYRIQRIGETLSLVESSPELVGKALQLLTEIRDELSKVSVSGGGKEAPFQKQNYPALDVKEKVGDIFPLIPAGMGANSFTHTEPANQSVFAQSHLEIGMGVLFEDAHGAHVLANVRASSMAMRAVNMESGIPHGMIARGEFNASTAFAGNGAPLYDIRFHGGASMLTPVPLGLWVALEANGLPKSFEKLFRFGGGLAVPVRIGEKSYLLVQASVGPSFQDFQHRKDIPRDDATLAIEKWLGEYAQKAGMYYEANLILRLAKFYVNFGYDQTFYVGHPTTGGDSLTGWQNNRKNLSAALTIPLGAVLRNDALKVDAGYIDYNLTDSSGNHSRIAVKKVGVLYELQW